MNFFRIMVFLILINVSVSIISALGIYQSTTDYNVDTKYDLENIEPTVVSHNPGAIFWRFFGHSISSLVIGGIAGAAIALIGQVPADRSIAYSAFSTFFLQSTFVTIGVLSNLAQEAESFGAAFAVNVIIALFIGIAGVSAVAFFMQLITSGWESYA